MTDCDTSVGPRLDFNIKLLRYFVAIAEEGSLTKASEKLRVAQPSLSQRMHALELDLGFALFTRAKRRVELSEAGDAFLPVARELVAHSRSMGQMIDDLRRGALGKLAIGRQLTLELPEKELLLRDFSRKYPAVEVVVESAVYSPDLLEDLRQSQIDLAFVAGVAPKDEFMSLLLRRCELSLLVPKESPLANSAEIALEALRGMPVAAHRRDANPTFHDRMSSLLKDVGAQLVIPPDSHLTMVSRYAEQQRIPALTLKEITPSAFQDMVWRDIIGRPLWLDYSIVRPKGQLRPVAMNFWRLAEITSAATSK